MNDCTSPEKAHLALVIIDTQQDFVVPGAPGFIPGTLEAVPRMARLVEKFRQKGLPIIHVVRLYREDGGNVDLCRRAAVAQGLKMVVPGSPGAEIMEELKPFPQVRLDAALLLSGKLQAIGPREWFIYKPRWGAFYQTPLEEHLRALGVNTLALGGCNFPNCPRTTIYEASERDFKIILVKDAVSGLYDQALLEMQNIGVNLMTAGECLIWLD
ncbi:MAG: cysteine hydrolase family protein [Desulfobaccales bacterium]